MDDQAPTDLSDVGPSESLGSLLAGLRRRSGLTGQQLARRVGMSQPKISRIERGTVQPDPRDVERLARELGASEQRIQHLITLAERPPERMLDWRLGADTLSQRQHDLAQLESEVRVLRVFQPAVIIGLLQTSEYARAVLTDVFTLNSQPGADVAAEVSAAVAARMERQQILAGASKQFRFVMTETVLQYRMCRPEDMLGQIQRLRDVVRRENVSLKIIPADVHPGYPLLHGFQLHDDRHIFIDLSNTAVTTRGKADLRLYRRMFDVFEARATEDIEPILSRYWGLYLDLTQSATR